MFFGRKKTRFLGSVPAIIAYIFVDIASECLTGTVFASEPVQVQKADSLPPAVQTYPSSGVIEQPRRVTEKQNHSKAKHQGDWGRFNWGNGEFAGFGPVGYYGLTPWAEDWSHLRDPKNRHDFFDDLKYISLNRHGTIWLSLSGETRLRNWYEGEPALGSVGHKNSGRFSVRNLYGADLHFGQNFHVFSQIVNADAAGWNYYNYGPTWRKRLGLQQLLGEVKGHIAGARTGFLFGRQQFMDAPSWLLFIRNTPGVPISWNGARAYAIWDSIRIDTYNFVGTNISKNHLFGDGMDYGTRLYGANVTMALPVFSLPSGFLRQAEIHSFLDIFWMGFRFGGAQAAIISANKAQSGVQTRQNAGFRWYGSARGFEYELGGVLQLGHFNSAGAQSQRRPVRAYALRSVAGWRHPSSDLHPFIGARADLYSGGHGSDSSGSVRGFVTPFTSQTTTFDSTMMLGRTNIMSLGPVVSITPLPFMNAQISGPFYWRQSRDDGLYSPNGRYKFLTPNRFHQAGRRVGVIPQGSLEFQVTRHLKWVVDGGIICLSSSMRRMGGKDGGYLLSTASFRF